MGLREKFGYKKSDLTKTKYHKPKPYVPYLAQITHKGIYFSCTNTSKLESGYHVLLLSAVARQCNVHRTVILKSKIDETRARKLLKKWIKSLPLEAIR